MQIAKTILFVMILATLCGCETLNKGVSQPERFRVELLAPKGTGPNAPGLFGCESATFSVEISGGNAPYIISWDLGGAAGNAQTHQASSGISSVSVEFSPLSADITFTAMVTVRDASSRIATDHVTFRLGSTQNLAPTIDSLTFEDRIIHVTGSDPDLCFGRAGSVTFTAMVIEGDINISPAMNQTPTSASFFVAAIDSLAGAEFTVTVEVTDGSASASDRVSGTIEPFPLVPDTLYSIFTADRITLEDSARVVVATGDTANPFQFMNGCGVVCESGASYVSRTFDVGSVDETPDVGSANPIDGVWADMGATNFLLAPDNFILKQDLGNGTSRTDFNITPLGGSDIIANGILFNFELTFAQSGPYRLGFEAVNVVSRTYYQDSTAAEDYFWSDISNNHAYNTILVEESQDS